MQLKHKLVAIAATLICAHATTCGAFSPTLMLAEGDDPVLARPVADLRRELDRVVAQLSLPKPAHSFVESTSESPESELVDLRAALRARGEVTNEIERLVHEYSEQRAELARYKRSWWMSDSEEHSAPTFPIVKIPSELPGEFADYFRGASAWHQRETNAAREAWTALIARPASERKFKSVWAAYMLARSWETEDAAKAITFFSVTRALAKDGFPDSHALAASSIGWQARVHLQRGEFERAIEMYLEQLAGGEDSAYESLRLTADRALNASSPALQRLATNRSARAVITAVLISNPGACWSTDEPARWLAAMERVDDIGIELAEQLALASYQGKQFAATRRWIKRAPNSIVSQWLQAKLHVQAGKTAEATKLLAALAPAFPLFQSTNNPTPSFAECLEVRRREYLSAGRHVLGELGVLRLHRGEYASALDCFLRAGFWSDATYAAERVLNVDELKSYVDWHWPEIAVDSPADEEAPHDIRASALSRNIRYLLARRLMRNERRLDARQYFPAERIATFDTLNGALLIAEDASQANDARAASYYIAAWIVRTNGLELMGTEGAPDYTMWNGNFEHGLTAKDREASAATAATGASADELARAQAHSVEPNVRWHYRAHAAALAYEAAKLLPNHDDRTARALYWAGRWVQDGDAADIFYKMLVRRCRYTELGNAADERRWFPSLDQDGRPSPFVGVPAEPEITVPETEDAAIAEDSETDEPDEQEPEPVIE